jgi:hypothetical protein
MCAVVNGQAATGQIQVNDVRHLADSSSSAIEAVHAG